MKMPIKNYARLWHDALQRAADNEQAAVTQAMLTRILRDGAYRQLSEIVRALQALSSADHGTEEVTVVSARLLPESVIHQLVKELLGHDRFTVKTRQDASVIGGCIVQTRDHRWDMTLKNQVRRLEHSVIA